MNDLARRDPEVVETARCDAQQVPANENAGGHAHLGARAAQAIPPALRRAGRLRIDGSASALRVGHADGSDYGQPQAGAVDVHAKVFAGLRGLGFRESEVRKVMTELRARTDLTGAQELLRAALAGLRRPRAE